MTRGEPPARGARSRPVPARPDRVRHSLRLHPQAGTDPVGRPGDNPLHRALPVQCLDPKIKSLSRLHFDLAMLQGKAAGVDVSIMLDLDGHVTEGPGFNVFVVKGGTLFSPPEGILMGITRQTVFEPVSATSWILATSPATAPSTPPFCLGIAISIAGFLLARHGDPVDARRRCLRSAVESGGAPG